ncbi:MAG: DedA family protein [Firmicutes bacterium]|nr:DedA family protein [Bacillota bacterium]
MAEWIELLVNFIMHLVATLGYTGVFVAHFAEGAWVPITSEVFLLFGGFLVFEGRFSFWGIVLAGALGFALGSLIPFFMSRYGGLPLIMHYGKYVHLTHSRVRKVRRWFNQYGEWVVFATRALPVLRNVITLPAGLSKMHGFKFFFYTLAGFLPWVAFVTFLGFKMGQKWEQITPYFEYLARGVLIAAAVFVIYLFVRFWQVRASYSEGDR